MPRTMRTLEQLILLRAHKVSDLSGQLSSQRQLCQRYENNIQALQSLAVSPTVERESAGMKRAFSWRSISVVRMRLSTRRAECRS